MLQPPHRPRFRVRFDRLFRAFVVGGCLLAASTTAVAVVGVERPASGADPASSGLSPYERGRAFGKGTVLLVVTGVFLWRFFRPRRD